MRALILAAGFATRWLPLSHTLPKCALPLLNRPLLHHVLDWLQGAGVGEAAVNLHHLPEAVRSCAEAHEELGAGLRFSLEAPEILLSAGALAPLRDFLGGGGTFVLVNGKILTDIDLPACLAAHRRSGCAATLVALPNNTGEPFSHLKTDARGRYAGAIPYARARERGAAPLVFTGIHLLEPEVLAHVPDGVPYDTIRHLYPELPGRGLPVGVHVAGGRWREYSNPLRYLQGSLELLPQMAAIRGEGWPRFRSGPPVADGGGLRFPEGCCAAGELAPPDGATARAANAVLGPGAWLGPGSRVADSVLMDGCRVGSGAEVRGCVAGPGVAVPDGARWEGVFAVAPAAPGAGLELVPLAATGGR